MFTVRTNLLRSLRVLALVFTVAFAAKSVAFDADSNKWTLNRTVTMHLSLGGPQQLQDGFTSFNGSAADALNAWNQHLVHLKFAWISGSQLPPADGDSDNSVFFANTIYGDSFGNNTVAITLISSRETSGSPTKVIETDVIFNSAENWDSYRGPQQSGALDFHRVALHEFGHVLGLNHPDQAGQKVAAMMNSVVGNIDALQQDDISGARFLYDSGPAYQQTIPAPHLVNLSTRALVGVGDNVLIGGFIIQGSQPATVIVRGIGHSLAAYGIQNPLTDPVIELRNANNQLIEDNDDWVDGSGAQAVASYRLDPTNSREAALVRTLNPGNYTVVLRAFDNGDGDLTGTGLIELYTVNNTPSRAGNIASRGQILTGNDVMIAGFIVGGNQAKDVVVRGIGPSLSGFGVPNALPDPTITVVNASGVTVGSNDDWEDDPNAQAVRDANLAPSNEREAALRVGLNPGNYTAVMRGYENATGIGLVEVYDRSPAPQ